MDISIAVTPRLLDLIGAKAKSARYTKTGKVAPAASPLPERRDQLISASQAHGGSAGRALVKSGAADPGCFTAPRSVAKAG